MDEEDIKVGKKGKEEVRGREERQKNKKVEIGKADESSKRKKIKKRR